MVASLAGVALCVSLGSLALTVYMFTAYTGPQCACSATQSSVQPIAAGHGTHSATQTPSTGEYQLIINHLARVLVDSFRP